MEFRNTSQEPSAALSKNSEFSRADGHDVLKHVRSLEFGENSHKPRHFPPILPSMNTVFSQSALGLHTWTMLNFVKI
ncbi:MAG: hypothetical protein RIK87_25655 [Fuerstiella sp.]